MENHRIHAVLQAGGRGQRLGQLTQTVPKPLVPVGGVPMIERLMRQLNDFGVGKFTVLTGYMGEKIQSHCSKLVRAETLPEVTFIREDAPLGNFGAMANVEQDETIIFAFADLVTDIDFAQLLSVHWRSSAEVTLASHIESYQVSLGEILSDGSRVLAYKEKPTKDYTICSGIAVIEPATLDVLQSGQAYGISDFVNLAITAGHHVEHWMHGSTVFDVNTPEALSRANEQANPTDPSR